jgi:glycerate kinase
VDVRRLPGSGAAGGLAGGLAALGARLVSGFDAVAAELGFDRALAAVDLVITGEGKLDAQSFEGKVVGGVAQRAGRRGVPLLAIAGTVSGSLPEGIAAVSLSERFGASRSMLDPLTCVRVATCDYLRTRAAAATAG